MPKPMTGKSATVPKLLYKLIYSGLPHWLTRIVPPRKNITRVPSHDLQFIE